MPVGYQTDLWSALPRELAAVFRPAAHDAAEEILREIQSAITEYARPLDSPFGRVVADAVHHAIRQFVDRLADPARPQPERIELFRHLGRLEVANGRGVDVLQSAYRLGARVAWRRMAQVGQRAGVPVATMCRLAEAVFAYIEELSSLSFEGYSAARARESGALERRRRRLLELVLARPRASHAVIVDAARAARFDLPGQVVAVALEPVRGQRPQALPELDDGILMDLEGDHPCLVLAADSGQGLRGIEAELLGWRAVAGPRVDLADAAQSLRIARRVLALLHNRTVPLGRIVDSEQHLSAVWLLGDDFLVRHLARRRLAPLAGLTDKQRSRLAGTLLAWLRTQGNVPAAATALGVHPQTVRYRLHQLTELFGTGLDDPETRFDLEVSLRALRLLGTPA